MIHSMMSTHILESFSINTLNWLSAGSSELSAPNSFSASNLSETRKMKCGELEGTFPPNLSAYLFRRSGRIVMSPLKSFLTYRISLTSPSLIIDWTSAHSTFCGLAPVLLKSSQPISRINTM